MALKDDLRSNVPIDLRQTPEFKVLLALVKKEKLTSVVQLRRYLATHIKKEEDWLRKNKKTSVQGTKNRWLRMHTKHYDFLKLIRKKILPYL